MRTRRALTEDAPAAAAVHVRSWRAAYHGPMPPAALADLSESSLEAMWARRLEVQEPTVLVAEDAGAVVGWVSLRASGGVGEVLGLYVDPPAWSTGAGRLLMGRALDALRGAGAERVELWVLAGNGRARPFYEAAGFGAVEGDERVVERHGVSLPEVKYERGVP